MDKDQYIHWKATRGDDTSKWRRQDCIAADRHVKEVSLARFEVLISKIEMPKPLREFVVTMTRTHFGSVEVDEMLQAIGAYPDYI